MKSEEEAGESLGIPRERRNGSPGFAEEAQEGSGPQLGQNDVC